MCIGHLFYMIAQIPTQIMPVTAGVRSYVSDSIISGMTRRPRILRPVPVFALSVAADQHRPSDGDGFVRARRSSSLWRW